MKIYYIGAFKRLWDEECIAQSFEDCGCEVIRQEQRGYTNAQFIKEIKKHNPDIVLFAKLLIIGDGWELLKSIKELGIPTVSWTFDLYCNYHREVTIPNLPFFYADYVFTTDGGNQKKFEKYGINHTCVRQGIYEPHAFIGNPKPEYRFDVAFVGTSNPNYPFRTELTNFLSDNYDFKWVGKEDPNTFRGTDLNDFYATVKIVVGDSVPSPEYWSNRLYETLGRGGFIIFPEIEGIKKEYPMLPTYKGLDDLKEKIDYWLEHDIERTKLQIEMFDFTRINYTYKIRCQTILKILEQKLGGIKG